VVNFSRAGAGPRLCLAKLHMRVGISIPHRPRPPDVTTRPVGSATATTPRTSADGLDSIERSNLPKYAKRELTAVFTAGLIHDAALRHSELLLMLRLATTSSRSG